MNKNRIEGRHGTTSWHNTAKSSGLPVEVNAAVVQGSIVQLPGEISPAQAAEKSAEAIVVGETSRGRDARINNDTGRLPALCSGHAVRLRVGRCAIAQGHSPSEGLNRMEMS